MNDNNKKTTNNNNYNCTLLVSTCDKYIDALNPFFDLFYKYYPDCSFDIAINLEKCDYKYKDKHINIYNSYDESISWTKRLSNALRQIKTDYIFLVLEDTFIHKQVDDSVIKQWIQYMNDDNSICCINAFNFDLDTDLMHNVSNKKYPTLVRRPFISEFKLCAGIGLWRKEKLIKYLGENETPWEWEAYGTFRTFLHPSDKFYLIKSNSETPFDFGYENRKWSPICKGKWVLSECESLFKKEDIYVNYNKLGIYDETQFLIESKENPIIHWLRYSKFKVFIMLLLHMNYLNKKHKKVNHV